MPHWLKRALCLSDMTETNDACNTSISSLSNDVLLHLRRRRRSFQHQEYVALPSSFQSTNVQVKNVCQKLQEGVSIKRSLRGSLTNGDNRKGDQYSRQNEQWKVFPDIVNLSPFPFLMYQKKVLTETTTAKPPLPEGMRKSIPSYILIPKKKRTNFRWTLVKAIASNALCNYGPARQF